jgi:hypothetical protein
MNPQPPKQVTPQPVQAAKPLVIKVSQERSTRTAMPCTWLLWL